MADVACRSCGTMNDAEEHRCVRCGKRLNFAAPHAVPDSYPTISSSGAAAATAPAFETYPGGATDPAPAPVAPGDYQPSLFREGGSPKVIPIPTLTPLRNSTRDGQAARRISPRAGSARQSAPRQGPPRPRPNPGFQQALDLQAIDPSASGQAALEPVPGSQMHGELIFCNERVAPPMHRFLAAFVDTSVVVVALGLFLGLYTLLTIFVGASSDIVIDRQTLPLIGVITLVITVFYRLLWCLADGDSPGMHFAGLHLVDFDGRRPDRRRRYVRQVASLLSLAACTVGMVWALVDEEKLTWHDHISKTFPTAG